MNRETIINQLRSIVKPYVKDQQAFDNLSESTDFITDLKVNSANLVDIVLDVEETFGITIDNESMQKMLTVAAAVQIVESKLGAS